MQKGLERVYVQPDVYDVEARIVFQLCFYLYAVGTGLHNVNCNHILVVFRDEMCGRRDEVCNKEG